MIIKKDNGVMLEKDDGLAGDKVTKEQLLESAKREFLEKGYFNGTSEETDITNLYFGNVKELFAAFNVNPLEDTINFEITSSAKLNGTASTFQLSDATVIWNENYGELNTIIIKDKNSENFIECNPNHNVLRLRIQL